MPDDKTNADRKEAQEASRNAAKIKDVDETEPGPRGNVFSEEEEASGPTGASPPPMPN